MFLMVGNLPEQSKICSEAKKKSRKNLHNTIARRKRAEVEKERLANYPELVWSNLQNWCFLRSTADFVGNILSTKTVLFKEHH